MSTRTDIQLVVAAQDGDRQAYGRLAERYSRPIMALCAGAVGNFHDAEDLTQEAFLRGFTRIGRLRDAARFPAWIKQIARNLCLDFYRRHSRGEILVADVPDRPDRSARIDTDRIDLKRAADELPDRYRLPVVYYYFEGRSMATIAGELGVSPVTVRSRLYQARKRLRRRMTADPRRPARAGA